MNSALKGLLSQRYISLTLPEFSIHKSYNPKKSLVVAPTDDSNNVTQESPPAWTQEAHRPPRSKYSLCCSVGERGCTPTIHTWLGGGTPTRPGWGGTPSRPGQGVPHPDQKVPLHECKRHTAHHIACTRYAVLLGGGVYPPPSTPGWGVPNRPEMG